MVNVLTREWIVTECERIVRFISVGEIKMKLAPGIDLITYILGK